MPEQKPIFDDPPPDLNQQIAELERELKMRRQVYPRLIDKGSLTQEQATYRIRCVEEAIGRLVAWDRMPELDELTTQIEKVLAENAARYLWLREQDGGRAVCTIAYREEAACRFGYDQPDEAVDAAMQAQNRRGDHD